MATSLKDLRKRYPFVKEFATWNEANINKKPETVARWWLAMRKACPTCTILGADLLDRSNVGTWAQRFVKAAKRTPKVWGLHNYVDANRLKTTGTLDAAQGGQGRRLVHRDRRRRLAQQRLDGAVPRPARPTRPRRRSSCSRRSPS